MGRPGPGRRARRLRQPAGPVAQSRAEHRPGHQAGRDEAGAETRRPTPAAGRRSSTSPGRSSARRRWPNINKLDEADRKLALEQKLCAVQGSHLGGMGKPFKVVLNGKTVFLCCDGCEEEAKAKPDETLAKLGR